MSEKIFGLDWADIQAVQNKGSWRRKVEVDKPGDYGADPIGDGTFRMVPSGDVVDVVERNKRLGA